MLRGATVDIVRHHLNARVSSCVAGLARRLPGKAETEALACIGSEPCGVGHLVHSALATTRVLLTERKSVALWSMTSEFSRRPKISSDRIRLSRNGLVATCTGLTHARRSTLRTQLAH